MWYISRLSIVLPPHVFVMRLIAGALLSDGMKG